MRAAWPGPVLIKGITTAEDARRAVDAGVQGVIVSTHGGRQLDCLRGTASYLPAVVDAVGADIDVLVDGGVRRGTDVAKALALGARAVLVGRPWLWALAQGGTDGVTAMLGTLVAELDRTLTLLGCADIRDLDRSHLDGLSA